MTKEAVKKRVNDFFTDMEWMFDYQNWDRSVVFKEKDDNELAAQVRQEDEYRRITVDIYPCFFTHSPKEQREFLLHEFCHSFSHKLYCASIDLLDGKLHTKEQLRKLNEEATSRVVQIIDALLRGKLRYAKRGYERYLAKKK